VTDFDFAQIAVPFRMQPGLRRVARGARQLTPLVQGSGLWHEKQAVWAAGQSRQSVPGFDPQAAFDTIAAHAAWDPQVPLELAFEEDFAVLDAATGGTLPWLCVCVPSHWAPEVKVGLPLAAVHAPVADNAALLAASQQLVRLVTAGDAFERFVWTISPSGRHDQHPKRHPRAPWPATEDPAAFAEGCFLRSERQTFLPMPRHRQAVFTIRVMLQPLAQAVDSAGKARRLHDSLASMSDPVLAYKSLSAARAPLLRWLDGRST
jgi:hypothetical protein